MILSFSASHVPLYLAIYIYFRCHLYEFHSVLAVYASSVSTVVTHNVDTHAHNMGSTMNNPAGAQSLLVRIRFMTMVCQ